MSSEEPKDEAAPEERSLEERVIRETTGFALMRSLAGMLTFVSFWLLARILTPEDFGQYKIGLFYVGIGIILGDGGLGPAVVRRRGTPSSLTYRVAFTATCMLGAALLALLLLSVPFLPIEQEERWVLYGMSGLLLLPALSVVPYIRLQRDLRFGRQGRIEVQAQLLRHGTSIALALSGMGVWALVAGEFARVSAKVVLAYRAAPGFVGFGFNWRIFSALGVYGIKIQAAQICTHFRDNLAGGLVGGSLGATSAGFYDKAQDTSHLPVGGLQSFSRPQFPLYGKLRVTDPRLATLVRTTLRTTLLVGIPILGVIGSGAYLVPLIIGAQWLPSVPILVALLPGVLCELWVVPLLTFLQGHGRAGYGLAMLVLWAAGTWILASTSMTLSDGSLIAIAISQSVVSFLLSLLIYRKVARIFGKGARLLAGTVAPMLAGTVGTIAAITTFTLATQGSVQPPPAAALAAAAFLLSYPATLWLLEGNKLWQELRTLIRTLR